jgi:arsenate reductase
MAEGLLRALASDRFEVQSAGSERRDVHPLAVQAMAEHGIDISAHTPRLSLGLLRERWDYVISLYDVTHESRPLFSGAQRLDWYLPDPSRATGTDEERVQAFRTVRDDIAGRIREWLAVAQA